MPNPWCYCRQRLPCKWLSGAWKQTSMLECFQLEWLSEELLYQSPRGNSVFLLHCCLHKQHTHTEHTLIAVGRCQSDRAAVSNAAIQFTSSIHLHCQLVKCGSSGKRRFCLLSPLCLGWGGTEPWLGQAETLITAQLIPFSSRLRCCRGWWVEGERCPC